MSFRIDGVGLREAPGGKYWHWDIKDLGAGVYGVLQTGLGGNGLYRYELPSHPGDDGLTRLLAPEAFHVDLNATRDEAARRLAAALVWLGLGPERDQRGKIIGDTRKPRGQRRNSKKGRHKL